MFQVTLHIQISVSDLQRFPYNQTFIVYNFQLSSFFQSNPIPIVFGHNSKSFGLRLVKFLNFSDLTTKCLCNTRLVAVC